MELRQEQIDAFKDIHKDLPEFKKYSEKEVSEIANGVANYYLILFSIYQRIKKGNQNLAMSYA